MAEFRETFEKIKAEEASVQKLFAGDGKGVRSIKGRNTPEYKKKLSEAVSFVADIYDGRKPFHYFKEAMTTDDFPLMFGDILDRQLLANYQETPQVYRNFVKISTVPDFRSVKRFYTSGGEARLSVVEEQEEYPESALGEGKYVYSVQKYGRRMPFSWETMVNDDLDALKDVPARFGRAARRTESYFAASLYCGVDGPDGTLYSGGNANVVTTNPVLNIESLETALTVLYAQTDSDGEPIHIDMVHLVVSPALEITALNILNATQLVLTDQGGLANYELRVNNWMKGRFKLSVDAYIPEIATNSNANTCWFLFADPNNGRPALEMGFLRGHISPEIFIKSPNALRVGGGMADPMGGDFDTDSIQYKVRHIMGGRTIDPKMTVASQGDGS